MASERLQELFSCVTRGIDKEGERQELEELLAREGYQRTLVLPQDYTVPFVVPKDSVLVVQYPTPDPSNLIHFKEAMDRVREDLEKHGIKSFFVPDNITLAFMVPTHEKRSKKAIEGG